jgi:hypothetical protein
VDFLSPQNKALSPHLLGVFALPIKNSFVSKLKPKNCYYKHKNNLKTLFLKNTNRDR